MLTLADLKMCPDSMRPHIENVFNGEYAPTEKGKILQIERYHALDLGGNIGAFALWCNYFYGSRGSITSYEPHPDNAKMFRENTAHLSNVNLVESAVGGEGSGGVVNLHLTADNCGAHSTTTSRGKGSIVVTCVDATTLPKCNILKVDIEGAEFAVLKAYLAKVCLPDIVSVEWHSNRLRSSVDMLMTGSNYVLVTSCLYGPSLGVFNYVIERNMR
jgi:FkbM family methyltransferase